MKGNKNDNRKKKDVGTWLWIEYLSNLRFFEQKYQPSWKTFNADIVTSAKEDFVKWDDYIEWKAYIKMNEEL